MPLSMIATRTVRFGALPASSSFIARSEPMPAMLSEDWSRSCQFFGASSRTTAGTRVDAGTSVAGLAGADLGGAVSGIGAVVATVAGDEHATKANARRTSGDDFMRSSREKGIVQE